jgi:vesicular inhibitory amino acid transporter
MFNLFGTALNLSPPYFLAIAAALMIPTVWLPNLSALSFLGIFGVAATTTVVASVRAKPGRGNCVFRW